MLWILLCVWGATASGLGEGSGRRQAPSPWEPASPAPYPWAIVWGPTEAGSAEGRSRETEGGSAQGPGPQEEEKEGGSYGGAEEEEEEEEEQEEEEEGGPFLFESLPLDTDPQVYVTLIISSVIVLSAVGILLKFVWDRHKQRMRCGGMASAASRQGLMQRWTGVGDVADGGRGVRGGGGGGGAAFTEIRGLWGPLGMDSPSALGEGTQVSGMVYLSNRIPLVNM